MNWHLRHHAKPWLELEAACNQIYFGTPVKPEDGTPGTATPFRAVVVAGTCLVVNPTTGFEEPMSFGAYNGMAKLPETSLALAAKLREIADDIERRVKAVL